MNKDGRVVNSILDPLLSQFRDAATLTIARMAYKANPEVWTSLEACRDAVRYRRGNHGVSKRKLAKYKRPNQKPGNPFGDLPEGLVQIPDFAPCQIDEPGDYLILPDAHIPYHNRDALLIALDAIDKSRDATGIILNGDFCDHFGLSRWENDPRERDFPFEVDCTKKVLSVIRKAFPKVSIVWLAGNHEQRFERYMLLKAPELLGIPAFRWESVFDCETYRIRIVKDNMPIRLGKLNVLHGSEFKFAIQNPVNPARGMFLRAKANTLSSHFHQPSHHQENTLDDKQLTCWSTGCLCDLRPKWMPLNKWTLGFAVVSIDDKGGFSVQNKRIIGGKVYA